MATIQSAVRLNDMMSAPIRNITEAMNMMLSSWESLENATSSGLDVKDVESIRSKLNQATGALDKMGQEQQEFNRHVQNGSNAMDGLSDSIMGAVGAYASMQGLKQLINLSDGFAQTTARLSMIVDEQSNVEELNDKIFASAQRARAGFSQMADTVAKLSLSAPKAFTSNDETILFAETLNKLYAIAGTNQASIESSTLQLTQALGSGVLRGEEFNAVFEAAPNVMQTVADYMGVPIEKLRDMAAEGQITADIVKNALLSMSGEINEQFQDMPMTWSQVWVGVMNKLYYASIPLLNAINWLAQNWAVLEPIVIGATVAVGLYTAALLINKAALAQASFMEAAHAASGALAAGQTFAWTVQQYGLNAALYACPIVWILAAIIGVIAAIYGAVAAINKAKGTTISATGVIVGYITMVLNYIGNYIAAFVNFFANVWTDPIGSIARLFADLADNILGMIEVIAKGIDTVFGSNLAATVSGWRSGLSGLVEEKFGAGIEVMPTMDATDAFAAGYGLGEVIDDKVSGIFGGDIPAGLELSETIPAINDIASNTGDIKDSLDISNENLKYLRDSAEQETINRFTTAEIRVEMGGIQNNVNNNTDLDGMIDYMVTNVQEAMERVAEGVHN